MPSREHSRPGSIDRDPPGRRRHALGRDGGSRRRAGCSAIRRCATVELLAALAFGSGCGASAAGAGGAPSVATEAPRSHAATGDTDGTESTWSRIELPRQSLALSLPDAQNWKIVASNTWSELEEVASRSRVAFRLTRAERLVRPEDCESRARLERPGMPRTEDAVDRRSLRTPNGFVTVVTATVTESAASELRGDVTAFGAAIGRCLAVHYLTYATGPRRDQTIARRLALVADRLIPSIALLNVEDRVQPTPFER